MVNYRRAFIPGGTWSFKANLLERHRNDWRVREIDRLRETARRVCVRYPFHITAWVVLPDHLHCVWTLPPDDSDFSTQWRLIESGFSRHCPRPNDFPMQAKRPGSVALATALMGKPDPR